jgi:hypothetical protein
MASRPKRREFRGASASSPLKEEFRFLISLSHSLVQ